jgi:hypothetical protein
MSQVGWLISVIPATQEAEMGRSQFEASLGKDLADLISKNKPGVVVHAYNL